MLTVFQLLLSLVTRQTEDDKHDTTDEQAPDSQLKQTQNQSENAEETHPNSSDQGTLEVGNDAVSEPEELLGAANEESERSDAANPSPIASKTGETEPKASDESAGIEQTRVFGIDNSIAESKDGPNDVGVDTLPPNEPMGDKTSGSEGEVTEAPASIVANTVEAAESHDETTPPSDGAIDVDASGITNQMPETVNPVASLSSEVGEESIGAPAEATTSEEVASSNVSEVQPSETPEIESQISETDISVAPESPAETEVTATDQSEPTALEQETSPKVIEIPLGFGVIDEIHNFVDTSGSNRTQGAEQVVVNREDSAGGIAKPSIVQQPHEEGVTRSEHRLSLPQVGTEDTLILHFSIGLRDASDSEDRSTGSSGVRFSIQISGERRIGGVVTESKWNDHAIDLSKHAGKEIQVTFLTACDARKDGDNNTTLWGNPRILKLTLTSSAVEKGKTEPTAMKGLVIGSFNGMKPAGEDGSSAAGPNGALSVEEFACESPTPVSQIADEISQRMVSEAQTRGFSIEPPSQEFGVVLYAELPKFELSALGLNTALVTVSEDFEVQCTLRNTGTVDLSPANQTSVAINRVKLRRGRHVYPIKALDAGDETKLVWNLRRFSRESTAQISVVLKYQTPTGEVRQTLDTVIEIQPAAPKVPSQIIPELHTHNLQEHVVLGNKHLRLLFVQGTRGFEYITLFAARHGSYRQAATSHAMTTIRYQNSKNEADQLRIIPTIYRLAGNSLGESIVILAGEQQDTDGVNWCFETRFSLAEDDKYVRTGIQCFN